MFFASLNKLLATLASLTVNLADNGDGTITVLLLPRSKGDGEATLNAPLKLTGTPEELDAEFGTLIASYTEKRQSLAEQLETTTAILDAAKKESATKATKAVTKKASAAADESAAPGGDDDDDGSGDENGAGAGSESSSATPETSTASAPAKAADDIWS